jgi:uncharacterized protein
MTVEAPTAAYEVNRAPKGQTVRATQARSVASLRRLATTFVPSRYNVAVDVGGQRMAVYNTFSTSIVVLKSPHWESYLAPGNRHLVSPDAASRPLSDLLDRGFLVAEGIDEKELVRQHYERDRHNRQARLSVNILPTMACNVECPYCFQGMTQITTTPRMMSAETEDAAVRYLTSRLAGRRGMSVSWFGGEPLLGLRTIERLTPRLMAACQDAGVAYSAVVTTNGVLLDRAAVDLLVAAQVSMAQVSIDVPAAMKDDKQGRGTQDVVLDNLVYAAEKMTIQLRINMSRDDADEWDRLFAGITRRNLQHRLQAYIANVFQPEHARSQGVGSEVSHRQYVEVLKRERERAKMIGLRMDGTVASNCGSGCAATTDSAVTVDPDGLLYKCPDDAGRPERAFGSVFLNNVAKPENYLAWLTYDWFRYEECWECPMLPQCAGGCPHRRIFQPDLENDDHCYWFLRGDLEGRIKNTLAGLLAPHGDQQTGAPISCG